MLVVLVCVGCLFLMASGGFYFFFGVGREGGVQLFLLNKFFFFSLGRGRGTGQWW